MNVSLQQQHNGVLIVSHLRLSVSLHYLQFTSARTREILPGLMADGMEPLGKNFYGTISLFFHSQSVG
jgi:hypothetical protein